MVSKTQLTVRPSVYGHAHAISYELGVGAFIRVFDRCAEGHPDFPTRHIFCIPRHLLLVHVFFNMQIPCRRVPYPVKTLKPFSVLQAPDARRSNFAFTLVPVLLAVNAVEVMECLVS